LAGICATILPLETTLFRVGGRFCAFFSGPEIPFPGNGDSERQRLGSNARLRRRKSEHLVLPRPLGGHVGEAGHSHAMRQPPRDGRLHEIRRQEGKRDRHVDLPNAAPLAFGDAFTTQSYATGDFLKEYERPPIGGDPCDGSFL
jgi:hypothetical protein